MPIVAIIMTQDPLPLAPNLPSDPQGIPAALEWEAQRPSWDEYFLMMAKLAATRSTCLAFPVGAVIVKDRQVLATGYNGPPSGSPHCTALGYCYPGLSSCAASSSLPSRAVHAEANAIAQAARHGISTNGARIYVTLEPCLSCLKLLISAGIREVFYEMTYTQEGKAQVRDGFLELGLVKMEHIQLRPPIAQHSAHYLLNPTSVARATTFSG